jgi:integrase
MPHLTKRRIDQTSHTGAPGASCFLWDDDPTGLGLRIYPSGRKAFVISYRHRSRKRQMTLGNFGVLTLDQARRMARERLAEVAKGEDPLRTRQEARQAATFGDLATMYAERHAPKKRSGKDDLRRLDRQLLPRWGKRPLDEIDTPEVARMHQRIGRKHPTDANRMLSLVSKMFNLAVRWGLLPAGHPNPASGIDRYRETSRERFIRKSELPALKAAIADEPDLYVKAAIWLCLLTGLRKGELLRTQWRDIDWDEGLLTIPKTKSGRVHRVPLSPQARAILEALPRQAGNPYLFPGRIDGEPLKDLKRPWARIRERAGLDDIWFHDIRRSVGSWLVASGHSLPMVGQVLNHSSPSVTAVYARLTMDEVRGPLDLLGQELLGDTPENGEGSLSKASTTARETHR